MDKFKAEQVIRDGAAALQRGDNSGARKSFDAAIDAGFVSEQLLLLLAHSCRLAGDLQSEEAAVDRLLKLEPRSLRGLIMKGDCRHQAGDKRSATAFYQRAQSVSQGQKLPQQLEAEMAKVAQRLAANEEEYQQYLASRLRETLGEGEGSSRFRQSMDILSGKKQIYLQQPNAYYFPELPQRQFYERQEFDWVPRLEEAVECMKGELSDLLGEGDELFSPYLVTSEERPRVDFHGLADNPDWSTFYLIKDGAPVEENVKRCPKTFEALQHAPLPHITTRAPAVFFSRLKAGARIPPHTGMLNTRLICHLPLIVPSNCGLRVGNETRNWREGELLVFDDTIEHEAWNESERDRVVLIFDIWRPELSAAERRAVTALFEAVDDYGA